MTINISDLWKKNNFKSQKYAMLLKKKKKSNALNSASFLQKLEVAM